HTVDPDHPHGGGVAGVRRGRTRARRAAAADHLEHAGGAAGRRLLAAGSRLGPGRRARPAPARVEHARRGPARPAPRRPGGGLPHQLLVLADVSRALSEEERQAWQRLIRVLSHELNNSLAPIKSIAQSLVDLVRRDPVPPDWREDLGKGLGVIGGRAESLSRLMAAYARLARLPSPRLEAVSVAEWVQRVTALETRVVVTVCPGPDLTIEADGGQLDQLL